MLQYYLRAEGLALSWTGTGRLIFSLNYSDADFAAVCERFVRAAVRMQQDGWSWSDPATTNKSIRRAVLGEMLAHSFRSRMGGYLPAAVKHASSRPDRSTRRV
jgi:glutamate-1-semialdehyde 2,1-aminomutase